MTARHRVSKLFYSYLDLNDKNSSDRPNLAQLQNTNRRENQTNTRCWSQRERVRFILSAPRPWRGHMDFSSDIFFPVRRPGERILRAAPAVGRRDIEVERKSIPASRRREKSALIIVWKRIGRDFSLILEEFSFHRRWRDVIGFGQGCGVLENTNAL